MSATSNPVVGAWSGSEVSSGNPSGVSIYSGTTDNGSLYAPLITAAQYQAYESSIARQVVTVFDMPANAGKVVQIPVYDRITASGVAEGTAATFANTAATAHTITLTETVVAHRITDLLRDSAFNDVLSQLGDQAGRAIGEAIDSQVFANFTSFSTEAGSTAYGNVSVALADLTLSSLVKAQAILRARKLTGPFKAVLHPIQAYALKTQLTFTGSYSGAGGVPMISSVGETVMGTGYIGSFMGIDVYESSLVPIDGNGVADGAIFAPQALAHSMRGSIRLETQRQAAYRATDLVLTAVTGASLIRSNYGIRLSSDVGDLVGTSNYSGTYLS
jgi:N4-gp56 family major capsid protein